MAVEVAVEVGGAVLDVWGLTFDVRGGLRLAARRPLDGGVRLQVRSKLTHCFTPV